MTCNDVMFAAPPIPTPSTDTAAMESLRQELAELRANTVSYQQYEELQREVHQLKEALEQAKSSINKRVYELMAEVDEEKKTRLNTQVEIERIKKLVFS